MPTMRARVWTHEEDDLIRGLRGIGITYTVIGQRLGVTKNTVIARASKIGIMKTGSRKTGSSNASSSTDIKQLFMQLKNHRVVIPAPITLPKLKWMERPPI